MLRIVQMFPRDSRARTEDQEKALIALSSAFHATQHYYVFLERNKRTNNMENEIANKWYQVGVLLRKYDKHLANRLDLKSRYWREGATWSPSAIRDAGIKLDEVWREVNVLLK